MCLFFIKKFEYLVVILVIFITLIKCEETFREENTIGYSSQLFAVDLFKKLEKTNQLISPILIQVILSALPLKGKMANELTNVLHLPKNRYNWILSFKEFLSSMNSSDVELHIANMMYITNKINLKKGLRDSFKHYDMKIQSLDFRNSTAVADEINKWVQFQTNNKINNIIDPSSLTPDIVVLLLSVLYFNGNWESPFEESLTHQQKFYAYGKQEELVDMMTQQSNFYFAFNKELDAKFLEIPYKDSSFKLTIVLSNKRDGLNKLEENLDKVFQKQNLKLTETVLFLPKYTIESSIELKDILKKLGLISIFSDGIYFSRFTKLKMEKILQKSFIEVNEIGTEAAAVAEIAFSQRFGDIEREYFLADHPFLFFIRDEKSGIILFLGRFVN